MGIAVASTFAVDRGHFDVVLHGQSFSPPQQIHANSSVWAAASEVDSNDEPISGGAHVTVQQVVSSNNNSVTVRIWVDNVPNNIKVQVEAFCLT